MNMMINQWILGTGIPYTTFLDSQFFLVATMDFSHFSSRHPGRLLRLLRTRLLLRRGPSQSWVSNLRPQGNDFAWSVWGWTDHEQPKNTEGMSFSFFSIFLTCVRELRNSQVLAFLKTWVRRHQSLMNWVRGFALRRSWWKLQLEFQVVCEAAAAIQVGLQDFPTSTANSIERYWKWFRSGGVEVHRDGRQGDVPMPWTRYEMDSPDTHPRIWRGAPQHYV